MDAKIILADLCERDLYLFLHMSAKESSRMSENDIPKSVLGLPSGGKDDFEKVNRKLRMECGAYGNGVRKYNDLILVSYIRYYSSLTMF